MAAIPESELPRNKRRGGNALSAEEARELARRKRAEVAKAQAAEADGVNSLTDAFNHATMEEQNGVEEAPAKEDPEHLIGFARLYSGTLKVGDEIYALAPKFNPARPKAHPTPKKVKVEALYLLMGRSLESLQEVPAGVVFGIEGLEGAILKNGTLTSQLEGSPNLAAVSSSLTSTPIVRVALEPENPADLDKMIRGLKMLEQSDPCAIYEVLESGEHVLATAGELHLERCLKDLRERFARCEITVGEPIVPYRETIVKADEMNPPRDPQLARGTVIADTSSKQVQVRLRVRPLPAAVTEFLSKNAASIKRLYAERRAKEQGDRESDESDTASEAPKDEDAVAEEDTSLVEAGHILTLEDFKKQLQKAFAEAKGEKEVWGGVVEKIAAFGPKRTGPNLFIDATEHGCCTKALAQDTTQNGTSITDESADTAAPLTARDFTDKIIHAFQLSTYQGPLCSEPVQGIAVFLESVTIADGAERQSLGRLTGEVIRSVRFAIHAGFLDWSPRIMLAMYICEIQASTEVLGRVYGVLTKRLGRVLSESVSPADLNLFTILAALPLATSFGFPTEILTRTSGYSSPQLRFSGFEAVDQDPFWVPQTEEELEDLGEVADRENVAKRFVDGVRRRKGLFVKGAAIRSEAQKTLKR